MNRKQITEQVLFFPWTLWCMAWFLLVIFIFFPFLVLVVVMGNQQLIRLAHFIPHYLSIFLLKVWGVRLEIRGKELINSDKQLIYVSNHRSYLDAFIASASIPNYTKFLGKAEIKSWPVLGYLMEKFYVGVQRDDEKDRQRSMMLMSEKLKSGASFFICPEGTCNTTSSLLKHFHSGAFRLAIYHQLPIVPLTFVGSGELFPRHGLMLRPGKIVVVWHNEISTIGSTDKDVDALREKAIIQMQEDLRLFYPDGKYEMVK